MTREEAFSELLRIDPQQAAWLRVIAGALGKPTAITIRFDADAYTQGTFEKQPAPLPAVRAKRHRKRRG